PPGRTRGNGRRPRPPAACSAAWTDWDETECNQDSLPPGRSPFGGGNSLSRLRALAGEGWGGGTLGIVKRPLPDPPPQAGEGEAPHPLKSERDALADADAHGGERELALFLFETMDRGEREPRPRHAQWMTECDRAAMGVHLRGIVGQAELAQAGERLGSK